MAPRFPSRHRPEDPFLDGTVPDALKRQASVHIFNIWEAHLSAGGKCDQRRLLSRSAFMPPRELSPRERGPYRSPSKGRGRVSGPRGTSGDCCRSGRDNPGIPLVERDYTSEPLPSFGRQSIHTFPRLLPFSFPGPRVPGPGTCDRAPKSLLPDTNSSCYHMGVTRCGRPPPPSLRP